MNGITIKICGDAGAGKDTAAQLIRSIDYQNKWHVCGFADAVKDVFVLLTGLPKPHLQQDKAMFLPEWGMTVREMLQKIGTDAIRDQLHADAWVKVLQHRAAKWRYVIITDCRFQNELDAQIGLGTNYSIYIDRPNNPLPKMGHVSENALLDSKFDFYVSNDKTIFELREQLVDVMGKIWVSQKFDKVITNVGTDPIRFR